MRWENLSDTLYWKSLRRFKSCMPQRLHRKPKASNNDVEKHPSPII